MNKKNKKTTPKKPRKILIGLVTLAVVIVGVILISKAINPQVEERVVVFTVAEGESTDLIVSRLAEDELISGTKQFYKLIDEQQAVFYANDYQLNTVMTDEEVLTILASPTSNIENNKLVVIEGEVVVDIAEKLAKLLETEVTSQQILDYWADVDVLKQMINDYYFLTDEILDDRILFPLEGYFSPATYTVGKNDTMVSITEKMLDKTGEDLQKYKLSEGYTYHKYLTLASVIQRETLHQSDKPDVAGVFVNRLAADMPLQSDITVLYAMQKHYEEVLYSHLEYESPYNTYLNAGLPPGPISNSDSYSIDAAFNPADNDYLYFFAKQDTGEVLFSKTYEEHLKISEENAWVFE